MNLVLTEACKKYKVPGCQVVVFSKKKILHAYSIGLANLATATKVEPQTAFEVASLSKPVFHYLLTVMVQNGALPSTFFADTLYRYIDTNRQVRPSRIPSVKGLGDYLHFSERYPKEWFRKITILQLLTHTAGLGDWMNPIPQFYLPPGSRFQYCDEGYILLQRVVEHHTGMPLQQLVDRYFAKSLAGVSRFAWDTTCLNYASGYDKDLKPGREIWKTAEGCVHGSLSASALAYARFVQQVAKAGYWEKGVPVPVAGELYWQPGWGLEKTRKGPVYWHWGNDIIYQHYVGYSPDLDFGLVVFTNSENGLRLCQFVADTLFPVKISGLQWVLGGV